MKQYLNNKKASEKFYTRLNSGFREIQGTPVKIALFGVELDAVLHNAKKDGTDNVKWNIIEQQTGYKLDSGSTMQGAIESTKSRLKAVEESFAADGKTAEQFYHEYFTDKPLSPRYCKGE